MFASLLCHSLIYLSSLKLCVDCNAFHTFIRCHRLMRLCLSACWIS
uniref:Uncharacterized protein n=1 Tax=viral metagenome TaxID=1070528 RepID=A0A6C0BNG8_9ZZZZ